MNAALQNFKRPGIFILYAALLIISVYISVAAGSAVDQWMKPANPSPILFAGTQLVAVFTVIVSAIEIAGFGFVLMAGQTKLWEMIQQISNAVVECLILLVIVACTIVLSFPGRHPHRPLSWLALLGAWFVLWVGAGLLISFLLQAIANTNGGYSWFRRRAARPCYIMLYGSRRLKHVQNSEGEGVQPDPATDTVTTAALKETENTRSQKELQPSLGAMNESNTLEALLASIREVIKNSFQTVAVRLRTAAIVALIATPFLTPFRNNPVLLVVGSFLCGFVIFIFHSARDSAKKIPTGIRSGPSEPGEATEQESSPQ
jgi:hypothetical protein